MMSADDAALARRTAAQRPAPHLASVSAAAGGPAEAPAAQEVVVDLLGSASAPRRASSYRLATRNDVVSVYRGKRRVGALPSGAAEQYAPLIEASPTGSIDVIGAADATGRLSLQMPTAAVLRAE
jgi:hypothetical protein